MISFCYERAVSTFALPLLKQVCEAQHVQLFMVWNQAAETLQKEDYEAIMLQSKTVSAMFLVLAHNRGEAFSLVKKVVDTYGMLNERVL